MTTTTSNGTMGIRDKINEYTKLLRELRSIPDTVEAVSLGELEQRLRSGERSDLFIPHGDIPAAHDVVDKFLNDANQPGHGLCIDRAEYASERGLPWQPDWLRVQIYHSGDGHNHS